MLEIVKGDLNDNYYQLNHLDHDGIKFYYSSQQLIYFTEDTLLLYSRHNPAQENMFCDLIGLWAEACCTTVLSIQ